MHKELAEVVSKDALAALEQPMQRGDHEALTVQELFQVHLLQYSRTRLIQKIFVALSFIPIIAATIDAVPAEDG